MNFYILIEIRGKPGVGVKGSPITKALTCMKFTCTNKNGNFVKETDTSGYIIYEQFIHYTKIDLRPNKQHLSTQQQAYQSFLSCFLL